MPLHADCALHNIANKSKSYSSITLWLAMPVAENMLGPLTIKHLPTPMHYIINIRRNLWTFAIANVHGKNSSWNFHLGVHFEISVPRDM